VSPEKESTVRESAPAPTAAANPGAGAGPLGALLDISMPVIIEIGRTSLTVSELLDLGIGSLVQLDNLAGEPVDVLVSDRKLAEGEVVVVGDHLGVRITRVVNAQNEEAARS
jgi:flagellar motor switch protein FliN/FliY